MLANSRAVLLNDSATVQRQTEGVGVGRREQATQKRAFPLFVFSTFPRNHNSYLIAASSTQSLVLPFEANRNVCIGAW